jgi:hypothetical protein
MEWSTPKKSGMVSMELLVLLFATGILSVIGMRAVYISLESMERITTATMEEQAIFDFRRRLRWMLQQSPRVTAVDEVLMEVQGRGESGWTELEKLRIRTIGEGTLHWAESEGPTATGFPARINFRFPDASWKELRQGFAIRTD